MEKIGITRKIVLAARESIGSILWDNFSDTIIRKNSLTVLMLHRVTPDAVKTIGDQHLCIGSKKLENTIDFLRKKFTLYDLYSRPQNINRGLSITFDDGWQDNYPIAKQYFIKNSIPFTIFLTTDFIGTNKTLWFHSLDLLFHFVEHTKVIDFLKRSIPVTEKIKTTTEIIYELKKLPSKKIDDIIAKAEEKFGINIRSTQQCTMLNWEQVTEMAEAGATFGSHGMRHAIMPVLDDAEKIYEAEESWKILKNRVKTFIPVYCFPNGSYNQKCVEICKKLGYTSGLSANLQMQQYDETFKITPRIPISDSMPMNLIKFKICMAHLKKKTG